jgi:hypothetical protein
MASLYKDPSGNWRIHFRLGGRRFKRSLQTKRETEARAVAGRTEDNIQLVKRDLESIPAGADVFLFLLSDGKVDRAVKLPERLSLAELLDGYIKSRSHPRQAVRIRRPCVGLRPPATSPEHGGVVASLRPARSWPVSMRRLPPQTPSHRPW